LQTWSNQGAVATSARTYASIEDALNSYQHWPESSNREWFLQGSYANHTNVRADSDIDVVALLKSTFQYVDRELNDEERTRLRATIGPVTYFWPEFRSDVFSALRGRYGNALVSEANKCFEVRPRDLLNAHVVPAFEYRLYHSFWSPTQCAVDNGVVFWTRSSTMFVNFPKQHRDNGVSKNALAGNHYKPAVRMFKNARTYLVEHGRLADGVAPSYCIECLLYNCPDPGFVDSYSQTFFNVLNYLNQCDLASLGCQNGIQGLIGDSPWQWSLASAQTFRDEIINLWNNWS
jgi:hypothetical protein